MPVVGLAKRWTFYIGKDGKVLFIDKEVKVDTAGADIAAKLAELGVAEEEIARQNLTSRRPSRPRTPP